MKRRRRRSIVVEEEKIYTIADLARNSRKYEENFTKLERTVGLPEHKEYVRIENRLNRKDVEIRKALGIYAYDPCPLNTSGNQYCSSCTGYYKREKNKRGKWRNVMSERGKRCELK